MGWKLAKAEVVSVAAVDRVIHVLGWYMLLVRPSVSVFEVSHRWLIDNRERRIPMPEQIRRELLVAIAIAPLIVAHLDLDLDLKAQAVDASNLGGAVVEREVPREALIEELQLAEMRGPRTRKAQRVAEDVSLNLREYRRLISTGLDYSKTSAPRLRCSSHHLACFRRRHCLTTSAVPHHDRNSSNDRTSQRG